MKTSEILAEAHDLLDDTIQLRRRSWIVSSRRSCASARISEVFIARDYTRGRNGAPGVTRTPGTQFRKLLLYPPELRGLVSMVRGRAGPVQLPKTPGPLQILVASPASVAWRRAVKRAFSRAKRRGSAACSSAKQGS